MGDVNMFSELLKTNGSHLTECQDPVLMMPVENINAKIRETIVSRFQVGRVGATDPRFAEGLVHPQMEVLLGPSPRQWRPMTIHQLEAHCMVRWKKTSELQFQSRTTNSRSHFGSLGNQT